MNPSEALVLHRVALRRIMRSYGLHNPRIFRAALAPANPADSDLEVLVESRDFVSLLALAGAEQEALRITGLRVCVLTPAFLSPKLLHQALKHAEPL